MRLQECLRGLVPEHLAQSKGGIEFNWQVLAVEALINCFEGLLQVLCVIKREIAVFTIGPAGSCTKDGVSRLEVRQHVSLEHRLDVPCEVIKLTKRLIKFSDRIK